MWREEGMWREERSQNTEGKREEGSYTKFKLNHRFLILFLSILFSYYLRQSAANDESSMRNQYYCTDKGILYLR